MEMQPDRAPLVLIRTPFSPTPPQVVPPSSLPTLQLPSPTCMQVGHLAEHRGAVNQRAVARGGAFFVSASSDSTVKGGGG